MEKNQITSSRFPSTSQEMSISEFIEKYWSLGGYRQVGNQFSNMDKFDYLYVIDKDILQKRRAANDKYLAMIKDEEAKHGVRFVSWMEYPPHLDKAREAYLNELEQLDPLVTNITGEFDAGFVSHSQHVSQGVEKTYSPSPNILRMSWNTTRSIGAGLTTALLKNGIRNTATRTMRMDVVILKPLRKSIQKRQSYRLVAPMLNKSGRMANIARFLPRLGWVVVCHRNNLAISTISVTR